MNTHQEIVDKITTFLTGIGIEVAQTELNDAETFVPGIRIDKGRITYDPAKLLYPGDLLHEAGHIAVLESEQRYALSGDVKAGVEGDILGDEIAAILWSFAASHALNLPLNVVFHPAGYRGASDWYIENFEKQSYLGLPLLVWMGFTYDTDSTDPDKKPFPHMTRWLRA